MLGGLKGSQALGRPTVSTDLPNGISKIGSINNYVFGTPSAASTAGRIGQDGHRSAVGRNLPEFPVCKVPDELSVWRPEGERGIFRAIQLCSRPGVQGLNVK